MHTVIPTTPRPPKGAGSLHVTVDLIQTHEYLCPFNTSAHLCFFKDTERYINGAGGRGTINNRCQWEEGVPLPFTIPEAAQAQSLLHLQAGCSLKEQRAVELERVENPETCAEIMAPIKRFQVPGNLKKLFLQSASWTFSQIK